MLNKIVISLLCVSILVACSKDKEEDGLLSCKSSATINQLLQDNTQFDHKLFSENISGVSFESAQDGSILCSATLNLNSLLDNQKKVLLPIKYKVATNNNKVEVAYISNKEQETREQWIKWAKQTNDQLVDYKILNNGVLFVKQDNQVSQSLNYNGNQISNNLVNNDNLKIEKEFDLAGSKIFLIGSYTGGTIDNTTKNHYLLSISPSNQVILTNAFAYRGDIEQKGDSLFLHLYDPEQVYPDNADIPLIEYKAGGFVNFEASSLTPKYDGLTAKSIIDIATRDDCYDPKYQVFDLSNSCDQALKYCKLFKKLQNPVHDSNYQILEQTCQ